ncbi:MAG: hypothetical protein RXQ56_03345 [Thermoproteus sp.]|jgi:transcription termination factor NusB|nr:MAG: hypothetical protein AT711_00990 [Thermoproteus sp. CIS_19]MCI4465683.1 hypothetical protein [Thermoproteus sp.]MDT7869960.1 hypothetical protein [Thermoproteus sp.]MDT7882158.1 hypothetical protein [Thermoproteus sp.]
MDPLKALRYRFVRYCINRAYVNIDISNKPAEFVNLLDDVVDELRDLEHVISEDPGKVEQVLTGDLMDKYRVLRERDREVARALFAGILRNCLDLEEISESKLGETIRRLLAEIERS